MHLVTMHTDTALDCFAATEVCPSRRAAALGMVQSVCSGRVDAYLATAGQDLDCTRAVAKGHVTAARVSDPRLALRVASIKAMLRGRLEAYLAR